MVSCSELHTERGAAHHGSRGLETCAHANEGWSSMCMPNTVNDKKYNYNDSEYCRHLDLVLICLLLVAPLAYGFISYMQPQDTCPDLGAQFLA